MDAGIRRRFWIWSAFMALMLVAFGLKVAPRMNVDTDILALLPRAEDAAVESALEQLANVMARRQLYLVGADDASQARASARAFAASLRDSQLFVSVTADVDANLHAIADAYRIHWPYLLAAGDRARLLDGQSELLYRDALRAAYTPSGMMRALPLAQDPLGLAGNFLQQQMPAIGNARLEGGMLMVAFEQRHFALVTAETRDSVFAAQALGRLSPTLDVAMRAARDGASSDVEIFSSGALQHAAAATTRARQEIGFFGAIQALAILALLFYAFGGLRPLWMSAAMLALCVAAAFTVTHIMFGYVHILALVFGSSLIGVVIDYSLHFFTDQFRAPETWTPSSGVAHVGPAIAMGAFTTLVGYLGLALLPFPGLRQIAVFCMSGIAVGLGSVLYLYPMLMRYRQKQLPTRALQLAARFDRALTAWQWSRGKLFVAIAFAVVIGMGALQVQSLDDIRTLQSSPLEILRNEQRVQQVLGGGMESRFFLVQGADEQTALTRVEALSDALDAAIRNNVLSSYISIAGAVPSLQRQESDHALLVRDVYGPKGVLQRVLRDFGFAEAQIDSQLAELRESGRPLSAKEWLNTPAASAYRHLWLGRLGGADKDGSESNSVASVVMLTGIRDVQALSQVAAQIEGVRFVDRPAEVSSVLGRYREVIFWLLAFANVIAFVATSVRYGWRDAIRVVAPISGACIATLGVFGWSSVEINLFNALALLLVLALGIDYGIFLRHGQTSRVTAILSVTLSACTTLIGFGMLAFSVTPFIRSIGITLLLGIFCSWAFALLSCMTNWQVSRQQTGGSAAKVIS